MTVAVYEPLIANWASGLTLYNTALHMVRRAYTSGRAERAHTTAVKGLVASRSRQSDSVFEKLLRADRALSAKLKSQPGIAFSIKNGGDPKSPFFSVFPNAIVTSEAVYPQGLLIDRSGRAPLMSPMRSLAGSRPGDLNGGDFGPGPPESGRYAPPVPVLIGDPVGDIDGAIDVPKTAGELKKSWEDILKNAIGVNISANQLRAMLLEAARNRLGNLKVEVGIDFLPTDGKPELFLSPIGLAHFYRQLYYSIGEGVGPIEQAMTIAPLETLEVVTETVRRQSHEEVFEMGSETVSETATESKNLDEVSDKVATMVQRDNSAAFSANVSASASGGIGVFQVSGSTSFGASSSFAQSSQQSREFATRRLKETTRRASERITKSFSVRVRDTTDFTTSNLTRRVIKNESANPVSYGLRRVFNRIKVKVQSMGPYLVWQVYIRNPGAGLARSKFVHFADTTHVAPPSDPPAIRPKPAGGTETGTQSSVVSWSSSDQSHYVTLVIPQGADRKITAVRIDSITDMENLTKDDYAPSPRNDIVFGQTITPDAQFQVSIGILRGDADSVSVNYTFTWEPSKAAVDAWDAEKQAAAKQQEQAVAAEREKALREDFERKRALITAKSKIRPRPAADLRREERFEVMNRMVSHLFRSTGNASAPAPLEIELFHRYFDIEGMFVYVHPSWWIPRYTSPAAGLSRAEYEITADSEPAPMGSSLGWKIQLDGDTRRSEFLNSPWVRACLPIRPGREREALAWLSEHIEGQIGYDPAVNPLKSLLEDIENIRSEQEKLGINGPEYVTVNSTVGAPGAPLTPVERLYPIIDEFEVTVPTEGFVYDRLDVQIP
jgi:hypothetical protein